MNEEYTPNIYKPEDEYVRQMTRAFVALSAAETAAPTVIHAGRINKVKNLAGQALANLMLADELMKEVQDGKSTILSAATVKNAASDRSN